MTVVRAAVFCLILPGLAACSEQIDSEAFRICRTVIPALVSADATVRVASVAPGSQRKGDISIVYRVSQPGRSVQFRTLLCRFAVGDIASGKPELLGVATENGPMPEASFFFLKRFHLDDPEASRLDPGPGDAETAGR